MKDSKAVIRRGYKVKLSSISVGVYDYMLPTDKSDYKYVLLGSQTQNGDRTKSNFRQDCTMVVEVVVRKMQVTGMLECDGIAAEIIALINPLSSANYIDLGNDFQCINTQLIGDDPANFMTKTEHVYRRLLRFNHTVLEK